MQEGVKIFWKAYAEQLVDSLSANIKLAEFTRNTAVIGAYSEASIIEFIEKFSAPLRCSTGSIISTRLTETNEALKQLDLMLWSPTPLPAIFDSAGFALVPEQAIHGVVEIKRSAYSNVGNAIKDKIDWVEEHVKGNFNFDKEMWSKIEPVMNSAPAGKEVSFPQELVDRLLQPDLHHIALGVVCIRDHNQKDKVLDSLIDEGKAVVLQEITSSGEIKVNISHVLHLIEYLKIVKLRIPQKLKTHGVSVKNIGTCFGEQVPGSLLRKK